MSAADEWPTCPDCSERTLCWACEDDYRYQLWKDEER